jgi:hypothetical protein
MNQNQNQNLISGIPVQNPQCLLLPTILDFNNLFLRPDSNQCQPNNSETSRMHILLPSSHSSSLQIHSPSHLPRAQEKAVY